MPTKKILIIEDDEFISDLYLRELSKEGYAVTVCRNAEEGEEKIQEKTFDMVLIDIMLPGKSGMDLLKELHEKNKTQQSIFVLLTNIGQETVVKQGFQLGAKGYLIKSAFSPKQVVHQINDYFAN